MEHEHIEHQSAELELDLLTAAEKEIFVLLQAEQYLAAAELTHQQRHLKNITTNKLAAVYKQAMQDKVYLQVFQLFENKPRLRKKGFSLILYRLTTNQGTPEKGVGCRSLTPEKVKKFHEPSGDSKFFSGNC